MIAIQIYNTTFCPETPESLLAKDSLRTSFSVRGGQHRVNGIEVDQELYKRTWELHKHTMDAKRPTNNDQGNLHSLARLLPHIVAYVLTNNE